jgi:hypothetical protein
VVVVQHETGSARQYGGSAFVETRDLEQTAPFLYRRTPVSSRQGRMRRCRESGRAQLLACVRRAQERDGEALHDLGKSLRLAPRIRCRLDAPIGGSVTHSRDDTDPGRRLKRNEYKHISPRAEAAQGGCVPGCLQRGAALSASGRTVLGFPCPPNEVGVPMEPQRRTAPFHAHQLRRVRAAARSVLDSFPACADSLLPKHLGR